MKHVSFTPDTNFGASRPNIRHFRSSTYYSAGTFSASSTEGFQNTSFFRDKFFDCSQLKVFAGSSDEVDAVLETSKQPPRNEGIVENHRLGEEILAHLQRFHTLDAATFAEALEGVDWVLLSMQNGLPVNFALHDTQDVEDSASDEDEPHDTSKTVATLPSPGRPVSSTHPEEHRTLLASTDRMHPLPQAILQGPTEEVASEEQGVLTSSPKELQPSSQALVPVHGSGVVTNNYIDDRDAFVEQPQNRALKSCLKKESAVGDAIPRAPKRSRWF